MTEESVRGFSDLAYIHAGMLSIIHPRPNKPMHPTADAQDFNFSKGAGRRVIGGVRRLIEQRGKAD